MTNKYKILLCGEIGHNWQDFDEIKELIGYIKRAGWDCAKFQLYDIDKIKKPGDTNYEELKIKQLSFSQMWVLKKWCDKAGVEFMCSVFDTERLGWYLETGPKWIKLAQRSSSDLKLLDKCLEFNLPIIASIDPENPVYCNYDEVVPGIDIFYLFCLSRRQILRKGIEWFPERFDCNRGYAFFSDHTIGNKYVYMAINSGATIIEKHITKDKNYPGWDQPASADLNDMMEIAQLARWREHQKEIGR